MWFLRPIAIALAFWLFVALAFLAVDSHRSDCLCLECEEQYIAEWESDHAELLQE